MTPEARAAAGNASGAPSISGTAMSGSAVAAGLGDVSDPDGILFDARYNTYTWLRCDANGDNCDTEIGTASTYTLTDAEVGLRIRLRFGFYDNDGNVESRTSPPWPAPAEDAIAALVVLDATGAPSISGRPKSGATVTAGPGDVADPDGIDESTLAYTWLRCDANGASCNIELGTGETITLPAGAVGRRIKVRLDFDDDDGDSESRTSAFWPASGSDAISANVTNATGQTRISGGRRTGLDVVAGLGNIRDSDGIDASTLSYAWWRCNATGADCDTAIGTGSTYTLTSDDVGLRVRVRAAFLDNADNAELGGISDAWPPIASDPVQATQSGNTTGVPTISGSALLGSTVVAASDGVADPDGVDEDTLGYTWLRCDANGNNCDTVLGTGSTYTLTADEVGFRIRVRVDFNDDGGNAESIESRVWPARTEHAIAETAPNAGGKPSISGTAAAGSTLTAGRDHVSDPDGIDESTVGYTWLRCDANGDSCETRMGTGSTYTLTAAEVGLRIRVRVDFSDFNGDAESIESFPWPARNHPAIAEAVPAGTTDSNASGAPSISGTAEAGQTLTAGRDHVSDPDGIDEGTVGYTWLRCDANAENCDIEIGTGSTYTLTDDEAGVRIRVRVDFDDDDGNAESLASSPWPARSAAVIAAAPSASGATGRPEISGRAVSGSGVAAATGTASAPDGIDASTVGWTWLRCDANGGSCGTEIGTGPSYTLTSADVGLRLRVRMDFKDGDGDSGSLRSWPWPSQRSDPIEPPDTVGPRLAAGGASVDGAVMRLRFDEALDAASEPAASAFAVTVAGSSARVSSVSVSGDTVTLTLVSAVSRGDAVTVGYTKPAVNPIQDTAGNDAGDLSAVSVTNLTAELSGAPTIVEVVPADTEVLLGVRAPSDDGGAPVSGYQYRYAAGASVPEDTAWTDAGETTVTLSGLVGVTVPGLRNGTAYAIDVRAVNRIGAGPGASTTTTTMAHLRNATGRPEFASGSTALAGYRVTATRNYVADPDGIDESTVAYTWLRCEASAEHCGTEIAAGPSYTLTRADVGLRLRVRLDFSDNEGTFESRRSYPWPPRDRNPIGAAPVVAALQVHGTRLDLTYDADLRTGATPPAGAFAVVADGQAVAVSGVAIADARTVRLTLARHVASDEVVTVGYTRPARGSDRIQDAGGVAAAAFSARSVENLTPENQEATGAPSIAGTAAVGETLTAAPGTIADGNGLTSASVDYRWIRVGDTETDISGATGATYTVTRADVGKSLKVSADFLDDAGYAETRTSAATAAVPDTAGPLLASGGASVDGTVLTLQFDEALDTASEPAASAFAVTVAGSSARVSSVSVSGGTVTLALDSAASAGDAVTVSYTRPSVNPIQDTAGNDAGDLSAVSVVNLRTAPPGAPTIVEVVPADTEVLLGVRAPSNDGGAPVSGYQYRYAAGASVSEDTAWTDAGETTVTLSGLTGVTVPDLRNGTAYAIEVRAVNRVGAGPGASTTTTTMAHLRNATGRPGFASDSTALAGSRVTATLNNVADPDGIDTGTLAYTWLRCDANGDSCNTEIAAGSSYTLTRADVGLRLRVRLDFSDNEGTFESLGSYPWPPRDRNPIGAAPVVAALQVSGDRLDLTYDADLKTGATPPAGAFAVVAGGQAVAVSGVVIVDARTVRLTLARRMTPDEAVTVGYTRPVGGSERIQDAGGVAAASFSARSAENLTPENQEATGAPSIAGTAEVGETLTAGRGTIADGNGLTSASVDYRWIRVGDTETDISGATGATYTVTRADVGKSLKVSADFLDDAGYAETRTSAATAAVPDTVGPRLAADGASVDGTVLTLQFDEALDTASEPAASAFAVTVAGSSARVLSVSVSGDTVTLTLASAVSPGDTVTVGYTKPSANPIQDALGNDAGDLSAVSVVNLRTAPPGAPTIVEVVPADTEVLLGVRAPSNDGGAPVSGYQYRYAAGASVSEDTAWTDAGETTVTLSGLTGVTVPDLRNGTAYAIEVRAVNRVGAGPGASTTTTTMAHLRNATGRPGFASDSTALAGSRVTATLNNVADPDGIDTGTLSYVWLRCDVSADNCGTEIAAGSSYTLTRADVGLRLRVRLDFNDNEGTFESRRSYPWPPRDRNPIGAAPVVAALQVHGTRLDLTYDADLKTGATPPVGAFAVAAGGQAVAVSGVAIVDARTVRLTLARGVTPDEAVTVGYTWPTRDGLRIQNADGAQSAAFSARSVENVTPENQEATGAPSIAGTAEFGETLTAAPGTIADGNGLENASFGYRWIRVGDTEADISGATGATYTVTREDMGKSLKVSADFRDDVGYAETRTSAATAAVPDTAGPRLAAGGASVDGAVLSLRFDEALDTASEPAASAFAVTVAGSSARVSSVSVSDDTVTLALASAVGRGDTVTVGYTRPSANPIQDALGNDAGDLSAVNVANLTVEPPGAPAIEEVTLADTEVLLGVRAPSDDGGAPVSGYQYRHVRGTSVPEDTAWTDAGETTVTSSGLDGVTVRGLRSGTAYAIEVRALNRVGAGPAADTTATTTTLLRNATGRPGFASGSTALAGYRVTAKLNHVADPDGIDTGTLAYTWLRCDANGDNCGTEIATGPSYTLTRADVGLRLRVRLDFSDNTGTFESLESMPWPNRLYAAIAAAPVIVGRQVRGDRLDLTYDADLRTTAVPPADAFAVAADGQAVAVSGVAIVDARTVRLTLARGVTPDETVTVGYTRPARGSERIQNGGGVAAAAFSARSVENVTPENEGPGNQEATGAPSITGTATVGETLTAGRGTIADGNGLANPRFVYQWIRVGDTEADISWATEATYTVTRKDVGKSLKVGVSFLDDARHAEELTSAATAVVPDTVGPRLAAGGASVDGAVLSLRFDEVLDTASAPAAGAFAVTVAGSSARVLSVSMSDDTVTLTLASAVSRSDTVTVSYTKPSANPIQDALGNDTGDLSAVNVVNRTAALPGAPTNVAVHPFSDTRLDLLWNAPTDSGGADITGYQYRHAAGSSVPQDTAWIDEATTAVALNDLRSGTPYVFEVRALNRAGAGPAASGSARTPGRTDHPATGAPAISGTVAVRETLTASTTGIGDGNGVSNAGYTYQWIRADGTASEDIPGARSGTYRVTLTDVGKTLAVRVTFTDDDGFAEVLTSAATIPVPDAANAPPTSRDAVVEFVEDGGRQAVPASAFAFADEDDGHALDRIRLETLPADGTLEYLAAGSQTTPAEATVGLEIPADRLGVGLTYRPAPDGYGSAYASFAFKVHDGIGYSTDSYTVTVDVTPTPDGPTGSPAISGTAKRGETLTAVLDDISDPDGLENAGFAYRWIRIGEDARGRETRDTIADADAATYTPVDADVGKQVAVEVTFTDDGGGTHSLTSAAYPAQGAISGNDRPTSADGTVETDEDVGYTFAASDFPFTDTDGGSLASVTIETLPASGTLALDGAGASEGQVIAVGDLDAGKLVYTPAENANGAGHASFDFRVNDGESDSETDYTMTVDVAPVNDGPDATDTTVTAAEDTAHAFGAADFGFVDVDGDSLAGVTIVTLPAKGSLTVPGPNAGDPPVAVVANQAIARARLDAGDLKFTPVADENGTAYTTFTFKVSDGTLESADSRTLTLDVTAVQDAPSAADNTVTTEEGLAYTFSTGDFNFADVDGDGLASVTIVTLPARGILEWDGTDFPAGFSFSADIISRGLLAYKPGRDTSGAGYASFTFKVAAPGGESAVHTMTIDVTGIDDPPTGYLSIEGRTIVGRTLTANTDNIDDPDGMTGASFTYSWKRVDGQDETEVGTEASYTVASGDLDKTLKLTVGFTDDGGTANEMSAETGFVWANTAPDNYGGSAFMDEDTSHAFGVSEFSMYDQDGDALTGVTIVTLPASDKGMLTLDGEDAGAPATAVTAGQAVAMADIEAGRLRYTPPADANGGEGHEEFASFAFKASDGLALSESAHMSLVVFPVNDAATGAPAITGTLAEGETLDADTSGIVDVDGLSDPGWNIEWRRLSADGTSWDYLASGSTYTATAEDVGFRLQLYVTFSDDGFGYEELTSEPSGEVQPPAANAPTSEDRTVTIDEDTTYGFSAADFAFSDQDDGDSLASVKITSLPAEGALTLDADNSDEDATAVSAGDAISAADIDSGKLKFTPAANAAGRPYASFTFKVSDGTEESDAYTVTINVTGVNDPASASGSPAISGTAEYGQVLTADISGISDIDGLTTDLAPVYQWIRVDGNDETDIGTATGSTYTLTAADVGKEIKVRVRVFDEFDDFTDLTSAAVAVADNAAPTGADKTVTTAEDTAYTFTTADFGFADTDAGDVLAGVRIVTLSVGLTLDGVAVSTGEMVAVADIGAGKLEYTPPADEYGDGLASFTFRVSDGISESVAANTITIDVTAVNDPAGGAPVVTAPNVFRVPATLRTDISTVTDVEGFNPVLGRVGYGWFRVDADGISNPVALDEDLSTYYQSTYTLAAADVGKRIKVELTFFDNEGNLERVPGAAWPATGTVMAAASCEAPELGPELGDGAAFIGSARTLAVGRETVGGTDRYGFSASVGSLGGSGFSIAGNTYAIERVQVSETGTLTVSLDADLGAIEKEVLVLHVCGSAFAFADASGPGGGHSYSWASSGLDWSGHAERTLRLSGDGAAPAVVSARAARTTLTITFDEDLGAAASLANAAFSVVRTPSGGDEETVDLRTGAAPAIAGATVTLTLAEPIRSTDTGIELSYTKPRSGSNNRLADRIGNEVASFAGRAVTNATGSAPTAADGTVTATEDTSYVFAADDFGYSDADEDALASVRIVTLPGEGKGSLTLDGNAVSANDAVSAADLGSSKLEYAPPENAHGEGFASFTFRVNDGIEDSGNVYTLTIDVDAVDDPASGLAISGTARVGLTLTANVSDVADADGLSSPGYGYRWVRVAADSTETEVGTDSAYSLVSADAVGRIRLEVTLTDDDGNEATLTAETGAVASNSAPTASDRTVTATEDTAHAFAAGDFGFADTDADDALASVRIVTLPASGTGSLTLDGAAVSAGDVVSATDIDAGELTYVPPQDAHGTGLASFTFRVSDGIFESASANTITIDVDAVDDPASGLAISGAAREGGVLTADVSGIADADGLTEPGYGYRWVRVEGDGTETEVGTGSSYVLVAADSGGTIRLEVSLTDDDGNAHTLTASTGTVAANAVPTASDKTVTTDEDTAHVFSAGDFGFADADSGDVLAGVRIVTLPAEGKGSLTLDGTAVAADDVVSAADIDAGDLGYAPPANAHGDALASFTFRVSDGTSESATANTLTIDVDAVDDPASGLAISGTAREGRKLTADVTGVADADGLTEPGYGYRWVRVEGDDTETEVGTGSSYVLVAADVGGTVRLEVSLTDDDGNAHTLTASTGTVASNAAPTAADKTVTTGEDTAYAFSAGDFGFADTDAGDVLAGVRIVTLPAEGKGSLTLDGTAVAADDVVSAADVDAGDLGYAPPADAHGAGLASFTFRVSDGTSESAAANTLTIDVDAVDDPASGLAISGTAREGRKLTADVSGIVDADGLTGPGYGYRWVRVASDSTETEVGTGSSYLLVAADVGGTVRLEVSLTDDDGNAQTLTASTGTVASNAAPTASDKTVTTVGGAAHVFSAGDFGFADTDPGDVLAGVRIVTLPAEGKGSLTLDGTAVAAGDMVSAEDIGASKLAYAPPANAHGDALASFTFRVSDGTSPSTAAYTMTVDVKASNTPATGAPSISVPNVMRVPAVLSADTGAIADADGMSDASWTYRWMRVGPGGRSGETTVGKNASTYTLTPADAGMKIKLEIGFTDDGGVAETAVSAAYPASGTVRAAAACAAPTYTGGAAPIWQGTLAVGAFKVNGQARGYGFGSEGGAETGGLDDRTFEVGSSRYTIDAVVRTLPGTGAYTDRLLFSLTGALADTHLSQLALHVCDTAYPLGYASRSSAPSFHHHWPADIDWSDQATRTLHLSRDTVAPTLVSATVDRASLTLAFDEVLVDEWPRRSNNALVVPRRAFKVKRTLSSGAQEAVPVIDTARIDGSAVTLTLGEKVGPGETVTVSYEAPDDHRKLSDRFGNDVVDFSDRSVTNDTVNTAPVAGDGTVTTPEDTAYVFAADDFGFSDADAVDALASVRIVTAPAEGKGSLALDGSAVSADDVVSAADIEAGKLTYVPPANAHGTAHASFTFRVSDGIVQSAAPNTMTVDVTPVNDPATGVPVIAGTAAVGERLNVSTADIADVDGMTKAVDGDADHAFTYQWIRVDGATEADIPGARSATYTLTADDDGKEVKVRVGFTDDAGSAEGPLESDAYPGTGAVVACGTPDFAAADRRSIWTGTLGVQEYVNTVADATVGYGFHQGGGPSGRVGSLSPARFTVGSNGYAVREAILFAGDDALLEPFYGYGTGHLLFSLDGALGEAEREALVLHVCSAQFALDDAAYRQFGANVHDYAWSAGSLDWSAVSQRTLHLSVLQTSAPALPTVSVADAQAAEGETLGFEVTLSEAASAAVTVAYATADATAVEGQDYTAVSGTLTFEVGTTAHTISVPATADGVAEPAETLTLTLSEVQGAVLDDGEALGTIAASTAVADFTASFLSVPPEHDGTGVFTLELRFSEEPHGLSYTTVRDSLFTVTGGTLNRARRLERPLNRRFELTLEPAGNDAVTLALADLPACDEAGAVCTEDDRTLAGTLALSVPGPAALSVADAAVEEGPGATLGFVVTLDRARHATVTVDYATADGTAVAEADYTAASGRLIFAPGETEKLVEVAVLPDAHDEGAETMSLTIRNAAGAVIADAEGVGTIRNEGPIPTAWNARFGRTVADQVLEAVEGRIEAPRQAGAEASLAGQALHGATPEEVDAFERREAQASLDALSAWLPDESGDDADGAHPQASRALTGRDFLTGTSFALTTGSEETGFGTFWGRGALGSFDGREGDLALDGEVATGMFGVDWMREGWSAGLIVSHSEGEGGWSGALADGADAGSGSAFGGKVEASLTGLFPWGRHALSERLEAWGAAGYGAGELTVTPKRSDTGGDGAAMRADLDLAMAAAGLRGTIVDGGGEGLTLTGKTDGMVVRTASGRGTGTDGGNLASSRATVTRLRLGVEASRAVALGGASVLTPSLEVGARHDGGDAESGFGLDLGGGLTLMDPERGLQAELRARGLLSHESKGFGERGVSGALAWRQQPDSERGATLTLTQTLGGASSGGTEALLSRATLDGLAANDDGDDAGGLESRRLDLTFGYGLPAFGGRFTWTPEAGLGLSDTGREFGLGWRLARGEGRDGASIDLSFEARRREAANDDVAPEHELGLRLQMQF